MLKTKKSCIKYFTITFFLFGLLFMSSNQVIAATYYVSTIGNDSNPCNNLGSNACATISGALNKASDGDTIKIEAGNYNVTSTIFIDGFNGITITANDPLNKPVITKTSEGVIRIGRSVPSDNVEISYLILDNGNRRTSYWYGIVRLDGGNGLHVHHNIIRDGWIGIELRGGHSVEINDNEIHNFGETGTDPESTDGPAIADYSRGGMNWATKIYIHHNTIYDAGDGYLAQNSSGVYYTEISFNDIYSHREDCIDLKWAHNFRIHNNLLHESLGDGIVGHAANPSNNVEIYNNKVYNNGWWGLYLGGISNLDVYNNLVYNNAKSTAYDTYHTYGVQGGSGRFHHNVVYDNGTNAGSKSHGGYSSSMVASNNVFYNNSGNKGNINSGSGGTISYNYVYPTSPGITGSNAITSSNPGFVNASSGNFNLQSNSPLINAGIDVGITTDFLDNLRPAGGGFDLGAYEFGGASGDYVAPDPPSNFQVVLN